MHSDGADFGSKFEFTFKATAHENSELLNIPSADRKKDTRLIETSTKVRKDVIDTNLSNLNASSDVLIHDLQKVVEFIEPSQNIVLSNLENDVPLSEASSDSFVDLDLDDSSYFSEENVILLTDDCALNIEALQRLLD